MRIIRIHLEVMDKNLWGKITLEENNEFYQIKTNGSMLKIKEDLQKFYKDYGDDKWEFEYRWLEAINRFNRIYKESFLTKILRLFCKIK